jgi:acetylornithine/succinyldiaminopimelate/putrescine aminotransferase
MLVRPVPYNDLARLEQVFAQYDRPPYKVAGFFHEIVLMNYGARLLTEEFLHRAYELCEAHDVPTVADEIQSGVWSPEMFMFRELGLRPKAVCVGKGFPGGEYPASRVLFTPDMDTLPQFGALVTNGQEELASLAYLITMAWAKANAQVTRAVGDYFEQRMRELADAHRQLAGFEGRRHLGALHFADMAQAKAFTAKLNHAGLDISVQAYKAAVPPAAMLKLPLICGYEVVDAIVKKMQQALEEPPGQGCDGGRR